MTSKSAPSAAAAQASRESVLSWATPRLIGKPPQAVTNVVSWRPEGIKYKKNEVFLDVIERLNCLVAANGSVISSEILGSVKMKCQLTGMPELKLGLNDKAMFEAQGRAEGAAAKKAVELEDIKFHQCVRLTRFESDRTISFIPPDGEFELMSYRLSTAVKPLIWVETVIEAHGRSRVEYMVKMRSQFKPRSYAKEVEIFIPVPPDVDSPAFRASQGSVTYVPDLDAIKWTLHQFHGGKEAIMRAHPRACAMLPGDRRHSRRPRTRADDVEADKWRKRSIQVRFEIPYFTVSGVQVRYLKVLEKSGYTALPWVRYITQGGDYALRMQ